MIEPNEMSESGATSGDRHAVWVCLCHACRSFRERMHEQLQNLLRLR